jgi:hypothetical protein
MPSIPRLISRLFGCVKSSPPPELPWQTRHPEWATRRPHQPLEANALFRVLADFHDAVQRGRSLAPGLLRHVLDCATTAPTLTANVSRWHWPDIRRAQDALTDHTFLAALGIDGRTHSPLRFEQQRQTAPQTQEEAQEEAWTHAQSKAFATLADQIRGLKPSQRMRQGDQWVIDGPMPLAELLRSHPPEWEAASRAARQRAATIGRTVPGMTPASRDVLEAMSLHLALWANARAGNGALRGDAAPDLSATIAQAIADLSPAERDALRPHLSRAKEWNQWTRNRFSPSTPAAPATLHGRRVPRGAVDVRISDATTRLANEAGRALRARAPDRLKPRPEAVTSAHRELWQAVEDIRKPKTWSGLGGEVAPFLLTSLPSWPKGRSLRIEDPLGQPLMELPNHGGEPLDPITVQFDRRAEHYSPVVDGQRRSVAPDGNCFFESVLQAMRNEDRFALFRAARLPRPPGKADLIQALRHQIADELERQLTDRDGPSEELRLLVIAHHRPAG